MYVLVGVFLVAVAIARPPQASAAELARILVHISPRKSLERLDGIVAISNSKEPRAARNSLHVLQEWASALGPLVLSQLKKSRLDCGVQQLRNIQRIPALGIADAEAVRFLQESLGCDNEQVVANAARALGGLGPYAEAAIPQLYKTMASPQKRLRKTAALAILDIRPSEISEITGKLLETDPELVVELRKRRLLQILENQ